MHFTRMKWVIRQGFSADCRRGRPSFSRGKRREKGANPRVRIGGGNRAIPEGNQKEVFVCRYSMPFWVFSRKS